jgi:polyhydroxyalkanoate synthesis regulator phasin
MAQPRKTDLRGKLAGLSEEAMQRLQDAPGADKLFGALNVMRDRVDELQRRVRGLEELERRLDALEKKVDKLSKTSAKAVGAKAADKPASD